MTAELPGTIEALQAALLAERAARQQAEACASGAEAMIAHLKLQIAIRGSTLPPMPGPYRRMSAAVPHE